MGLTLGCVTCACYLCFKRRCSPLQRLNVKSHPSQPDLEQSERPINFGEQEIANKSCVSTNKGASFDASIVKLNMSTSGLLGGNKPQRYHTNSLQDKDAIIKELTPKSKINSVGHHATGKLVSRLKDQQQNQFQDSFALHQNNPPSPNPQEQN